MRKLVLAALLTILSLPALAFDAYWPFADFVQNPQAIKQVYVTPLWTITVNGTNLIVGQRQTKQTGTAGVMVISNMIPGGYRVEFVGQQRTNTFTNVFGLDATGWTNAAFAIGGSSNTITAFKSIFLVRAGDTATHLTNGSPDLATNSASATDGMGLVKRGTNLSLEVIVGTGQPPSPTLTNLSNGDGSGLTDLNASQLSAGTIPTARLPAVVVTNAVGTNASAFSISNGTLFVPVDIAQSNSLYISQAVPRTTVGIRGDRNHPFGTAYDFYNTATTNDYGAALYALPGDWLIYEKAPLPYREPAIPLNRYPYTTNGVNLYVPEGVTIIRTNFSNTNGTALAANESTVGPLIFVGNSEVVINGLVIATNGTPATNNPIDLDSPLGYMDTTPAPLARFTNVVSTNVYVHGSGNIVGDYDGYLFRSASTSNLSVINLRLENITCIGLYWDASLFNGHPNTTNFLVIKNSRIEARNGASYNTSHGLWAYNFFITDYNSKFLAESSTGTGNQNGAISINSGSINMNGTQLIVTGNGTNTIPLFNNSLGQNTRQSAFLGYSSGSLPSGSWTETGPLGSTNINVNLASSFTFSFPTNRISTNHVVVAGGGDTGINQVNKGYVYVGPYFTNFGADRWMASNSVNADWEIYANGTLKYFNTNGSPISLTWIATNGASSTTPYSYYSNWVGNVRCAMTLSNFYDLWWQTPLATNRIVVGQ